MAAASRIASRLLMMASTLRRRRARQVRSHGALEVGVGPLEVRGGADVLQMHALGVPRRLEERGQIRSAGDVGGFRHAERLLCMWHVRAGEEVMQDERG